jgi:tetratricopeptide (TPR) repeat protein
MMVESILTMIPLLTFVIRRWPRLRATVALAAGLTAVSGCRSLESIVPAVLRPAADRTSDADGVIPASATERGDVMDASRHVSAALAAYQSGDFEQALRETQRARRIDPKLASACEMEALVSADAGDPDRQAEALLTVIAGHPDDPQIQHTAGELLVQTSHRAEGLAAMRAAIDRAPWNVDYVRDLAGVYVELGQTGQAVALLREGLSRNPSDRTLPIALARLYESSGDWESALRFYTVSLQNEPDQAGWRRQRARCLYQLGQYADAAAEFQRCLETDVISLTQTDRIEFGDACLQTGNVSQAAWLFDELSREGLATREVEILRGVCELRQGQTDEAEQILAAAQQRWPNDAALAMLRENAHRK